ncbi:MAG TPA: Ig-like domain repeat protein [Mycobacteriales bacterium]|nr:Ig-like domain repeat protein [Mycobacteriales bacterium]
MKARRLVLRVCAAAVPAALVLGSTGAAYAAKPVRTPVPTVTQTPAKASSSAAAAFGWVVDASTTYTCSLDGSAYTGCTSPASYSGLADRQHTFALRARAGAGKPATYSYGWVVDTVAPLAPVVSPIAGPTSNRTAAVSFTDSDTSVTAFTCALDGVAEPCTSPHGYSGLVDGLHTVVVTARDAAGNAASGSVSWTVDGSAPNIPVLTGPANPTNAPSAGVAFTGEVDAVFSCALDGAVPSACSSPWVPAAPLADGSHTLAVTAVDAASNSATGSVTWVVDTAPPTAPDLVSAPAVTTNDAAFTVRFAHTDLSTASYACTFESVTAPCTSPWVPGPGFTPANGLYTLQVRAQDLAGNQSDALGVSWTYDATAPSPAAFVSGPATPTTVTDPVFDFVDTDTTTTGFTCAVDLGSFVACDPGVTLSALVSPLPGDGSHTLHVRATDGLNTSASVDWTWVLDTSPPPLQPSTPPGGVTPGDQGPVSSAPTFTFGNPDPASVAGFVCSVDGGAWNACSSGFTPAVGDGAHTLQVAAVDQAGNVGTPVSYSWTLDTVAPVGTVGFPSTLTGAATVAFPESVQGVTASAVRLLVAGTTAVVLTRQTCLDAGAALTSCGGAVRTVVLTPVARLVPGQRYVLSTGSAVHDAAGNPASSPATVFRALRVLQESQAAVVQGWAPRASTAAYGGRYLQAHLAGASVSYAFRGTSVTWFTAKGRSMGTAKVYCGSTLKATVNNYAATTSWHVGRKVTCSSSTANNLLRVVATGRKGATAGTGTSVVVDAVKVSTLTSNPALAQRWGTTASTLASGGRYAYGDTRGESFSLTFRGTSITWRTLLGKGMGKATVYVDGVAKGTYDQFATTTKAGSRTWRLTDKVHTLKVVLTGTHRTGATGNRVVVDRLTVG